MSRGGRSLTEWLNLFPKVIWVREGGRLLSSRGWLNSMPNMMWVMCGGMRSVLDRYRSRATKKEGLVEIG